MKIAIIDDQDEIRYSVSKILKRAKYETVLFHGLESDIIARIKDEQIQLLIVDIMLSDDFSGIDLIKNLRQHNITLPAILMTAYTTPTNMIEASKIGIKDILQKPFTVDELKNIVKKYEEKDDAFIQVLDQINEEFVGSFETMKDIYSKIGVAANNDLPIMILGDTGTGKELIANLIHKNSRNSKSEILAINCASIPKELFESQLFGHEKGAFTDARTAHIGFAESVGDGTLFLDEIGEISTESQSKLLRFLENKTFRRVGGTHDIKFHGRIISATNININDNIEKDLFRQDLYYRLSMIKIEIPALNQRKKDIPALVDFFIKQANTELNLNIKGISNDALELLKKRTYKGNIRELKNTVYNSALNAHEDVIQKEHIQFEIEKTKDCSAQEIIAQMIEIRGIENAKEIHNSLEKEFYDILLQKCDNITHLAKYLDISRSTLRNILRKHHIISE
ncbi:sigma-54-dependent transcriptional regulator [Sulfurospirillum sp. 1612]|uniref:sigma-54-dependent transcriptional regulator n=1 Tax=Sulfurospirillum sp. 1612 TaxID=3094835 RepID=UPI002F92350C